MKDLQKILTVGLAGGTQSGVNHSDLLDALGPELGKGIGGEGRFKLEDAQLIVADIIPYIFVAEVNLVHPWIIQTGEFATVIDYLYGF